MSLLQRQHRRTKQRHSVQRDRGAIKVDSVTELWFDDPPEPDLPILWSDGIHDDSDALDALYSGQWYWNEKRQSRERVTGDRVFLSGPHLISRPLTREQRSRTYTDRPAPFVANPDPLPTTVPYAHDHRSEHQRRLPARHDTPEGAASPGGDAERSGLPDE